MRGGNLKINFDGEGRGQRRPVLGHFSLGGQRGARRPLAVSGQMRRFHRGRINTMPPEQSTDRSVAPTANWSSLSSAVRAVHNGLGRKAAEQLAVITGHDARSAQRFFSGERVPNGNAVFLMATDPATGPAFISEGTRRLSPQDHRDYWTRMAVAVGDALREKTEGF